MNCLHEYLPNLILLRKEKDEERLRKCSASATEEIRFRKELLNGEVSSNVFLKRMLPGKWPEMRRRCTFPVK